METRINPPNFSNFELITADNFRDHLPEIIDALHLPKTLTQDLVSGKNLATFKQDLEQSSEEILDAAAKTIEHTELGVCESEETQAYVEDKKAWFQRLLQELETHLTHTKSALISRETTAINDVVQQLTDPRKFYAGNYNRKLATLKKNLIVALQQAAYVLPNYWPDLKDNPDLFNAVFLNIAHLDEQGKISYPANAYDTFAHLDLKSFQDRFSALLTTAGQHPNPMVIRDICQFIRKFTSERSAKLKNGEVLFDLQTTPECKLIFTPKAFEVEKLALDAAAQARTLLNELDQNQSNALENYEHNNRETFEIKQRILDAIRLSSDNLVHHRNIVTRFHALSLKVTQGAQETEDKVAELEEISAHDPNKKREETINALLESGYQPAAAQRKMLELQDTLNRIKQDFIANNSLEFLLQHYSMLVEQYNLLKPELNQILQEATTQQPPLDHHLRHLDQIATRCKSLEDSLNTLYTLVDEKKAALKQTKKSYATAREQFLAQAMRAPESEKQFDPAPQEAPPALLPKRTFWTENPVKKRWMLGLFAGLAGMVIVGGIALSLLLTLGTALPAYVIAGITIGSAIAGGAAGNSIGEKIHDKIMQRFERQRESNGARNWRSSTGKFLDKFGGTGLDTNDLDDEPSVLTFDSDSDDQLEVIPDYSHPRTYGDDSRESSPLLRRSN